MNNEKGIVRGFILLVVLAVGGFWIAEHWWPTHNYRTFSAKLETAVNQQLFAGGVFDHQILSKVNREQTRGGFLVWVTSGKEIAVSSSAQRQDLQKRLHATAGHFFCQYDSHQSGNRTDIKIYQGPFVLQKITLLPEPEKKIEPIVVPIEPESPTGDVKGEVAIVIDDVATDLNIMDHFASLGIPLTFAILPRERLTRKLSDKAHQLGFPVILHLPMEPINLADNDPGSAGLFLKMNADELHAQFEKDVASVSHLAGINNHMGSAFTESEEKMSMVMPWVKEKHLFFLDSHTTEHSVVPKVAREFHVPCRVNDTFLDNKDEVVDIEKALDIVMRLALRRKHTIAIGHYRRKYLNEALKNKIPEFKAKGIVFVGLPELYRNKIK